MNERIYVKEKCMSSCKKVDIKERSAILSEFIIKNASIVMNEIPTKKTKEKNHERYSKNL